MQLFPFVALGAAAAVAQASAALQQANSCDPQCHKDACLVEVVGKELGWNYHQAFRDCKSFLRTTVTPTQTVTYTGATTITPSTLTQEVTDVTTSTSITVTTSSFAAATSLTTAVTDTTETTTIQILPRTIVTSSSIPRYAHDCHGAAQYASACSCIGVSIHTITAPISTVTVSRTSTATAIATAIATTVNTVDVTLMSTDSVPTTVLSTVSQTSTAIETATPVPASFNIVAFRSEFTQNLAAFQLSSTNNGYDRISAAGDAADEAIWNLDTSGNLYCVSAASYAYYQTGSTSYITVVPGGSNGNPNRLTCTLDGAMTNPGDTGNFTCYDPGYQDVILCDDLWAYSNDDPDTDCGYSIGVYLQYTIISPATIVQPSRRDPELAR